MRNFYEFEESLFAKNGNVVFGNFFQVRIFAEKMNRQRDLISSPDTAIKSGGLNAMGLIDEILHYVVGQYQKQKKKISSMMPRSGLKKRLETKNMRMF
jgi:hypothetical protein